MSHQLFFYHQDNITLPELFKSVLPEVAEKNDTIGLLYLPEQCCFIQVTGTADWITLERPAPDLNDVYEARFFNPEMELRWLHKDAGQGRAVLLSDQQLDCLNTKMEQYHQLKNICETKDRRYLLWGEGTSEWQDGWSILASARIGKIAVPVPQVAKNMRVQLVTREYLQEAQHGNVVIAEERLLELEMAVNYQ